MEEFKKMKSSLPPVMPFRWACAYGEDRIGLWQAFEVEGVRQVMRWIPPGELLKESPSYFLDLANNRQRTRVVHTNGFWLADTACTQALWVAVMESNPSRFQDDLQNPVERVSWNDITGLFLPKINGLMPGLNLLLPTGEQWEYACRAGTTEAFSFGDLITTDQVNYNPSYMTSKQRSGREKTLPVNALAKNAWGMYQMHGNVWEWCASLLGNPLGQGHVFDPKGLPVAPLDNEMDGGLPVLCGGSWRTADSNCRSAGRGGTGSEARADDIGFRLIRSAF